MCVENGKSINDNLFVSRFTILFIALAVPIRAAYRNKFRVEELVQI